MLRYKTHFTVLVHWDPSNSFVFLQIKNLPAPYKAFGNSACTDTNDPGFTNLLPKKEYNVQTCKEKCYWDLLFNSCKCRLGQDFTRKYNIQVQK